MPHPNQPSFSRGRRWKIGLDLAVRTLLVGAVVVMANFLGARFFHRFYLSARTTIQLSSRTMSVLHSLTNRVAVTLYYDRSDDFYPEINKLLKAYGDVNPNLSCRTVDPVRDAGEAEKVKAQYGLNTTGDKNLIIFDAGGGLPPQIRSGDTLIQYANTGVTKDKKLEFRPVAFRGEQLVTSVLIGLENARPFKAYFLQGDGEPSFTQTGNFDYFTFASVLEENNVTVAKLELSAALDVPADCNLLVYAAPGTDAKPLAEPELQKIAQYLAQGGRMLALFNYVSVQNPTGLESILQRWGVYVVPDTVQDPLHTTTGQDIKVSNYGNGKHPVVEPIAGNGLSLQMIWPRPVVRMTSENPPPDAPQVTELAFSSPDSTLAGAASAPSRSYPLIAAVEQKSAAGGVNTRGTARIIVAGDTVFLGNHYIQGGANRDFLANAVNWLLDRPQLLEGIASRPVTEYRLEMTRLQQREANWVLLGALPGAVLLLGGLVWLARRK